MPGGAFGDARLKELVKWQRGIGDPGTQMHLQVGVPIHKSPFRFSPQLNAEAETSFQTYLQASQFSQLTVKFTEGTVPCWPHGEHVGFGSIGLELPRCRFIMS